jgi:hypothetical protein
MRSRLIRIVLGLAAVTAVVAGPAGCKDEAKPNPELGPPPPDPGPNKRGAGKAPPGSDSPNKPPAGSQAPAGPAPIGAGKK